MREFKIIHIITRLEKGGSPKILLFLAKSLNKERFKVKIISGPTPKPEVDIGRFKKEAGIEVILIKELQRAIDLFKDLIALIKLYLILRRESPYIVQTHTSKAGFLGRLAARLAGVPLIIHMPHGHVFYGYFGRIKTRVFILLERLAAKFTNKIVTLTEIEKDEYIRFRIAMEDKFISIPNGIEIDKLLNFKINILEKKKELGLFQNSSIISTIARLEPVKGHRYLFEAIPEIKKEFADIKALIVGEGSLKKDLEKKTKELGISENILFLDANSDTRHIITISDLIVLPSLNEGLGLVLLEAQVLGKPVVATKVGGIPEAVLDGRTGILVPPRDSSAIAEAIIKLLKDKDLYNRMSEEARDWIVKNFSSEIMLKRFEGLYDGMLSKKD